jgi:hypothetical protein
MTEASKLLLEKAASLRDMAQRALRLAAELNEGDKARLTQYGKELREQADELERQAAAGVPSRPSEPGSSRSGTEKDQSPKKKRGGSDDADPQS